MLQLYAEKDGNRTLWGVYPTFEDAVDAVEAAEEQFQIWEEDDAPDTALLPRTAWPEGADAVAVRADGAEFMYTGDPEWERIDLP